MHHPVDCGPFPDDFAESSPLQYELFERARHLIKGSLQFSVGGGCSNGVDDFGKAGPFRLQQIELSREGPVK